MVTDTRFLHVVHDSSFIDTTYRVFEKVAPGRNEFVTFTKGRGLKHVRETPIKQYRHWAAYSQFIVRRICSGYRVVLLHNLTSQKLYLLRALPPSATVVWLGWGADYYDLVGHELLKPQTRSLQETARRRNALIRKRVAFKEWAVGRPDKDSLIQRVDYFSPVLWDDYRAVQKAQPTFRAKYIPWNYGTLEDDLAPYSESDSVSGQDILLGNSASYTNNHLDAFDLIKSLDLSERRIITPLSYGDSYYSRVVVERGQAQFGEKFVPLTNYLSRDSYVNLVKSCSIVVMNHRRQQAIGNIVMMLFLGAKVFLDSANPAYAYFKERGASVYSLEELNAEATDGLSRDAIVRNRHILREVWGRDVILDRTREMVSHLDEGAGYS